MRLIRVKQIQSLMLLLAAALLTACGGEETVSLPNLSGGTVVAAYSGPVPTTDDVQSFKLNVWDYLVEADRCGNCHSDGGQSPQFVRQDNINLAYAVANGIVDLVSPGQSRLVEKVAAGHNCWLASDTACADILTTYIANWAGESGGDGGRQIELLAPIAYDPGASKRLPEDSTLFASYVHPLLSSYCAGCHADDSATPQSPFFAQDDIEAAYDAVSTKIDLDNPANARLVLRLRNEFHNCWDDCDSNADEMEAAITAMSDGVTSTEIDAQLITSKALTLTDGIVASGGNRHESDLIALYEFKTGQGSTAYDTSGIEPVIDLTLSGNVQWVGGYGIEFIDGRAQGTTADSRKLRDLIAATGEYTVEAWVVPANVTQEGPARIISYSGSTQLRNFTLGQTQYNYDFMQRMQSSDANGEPALSTADADEDLQATLQHVVASYDPINGRRLFVNGAFTGDTDPAAASSLASWDDTFALVMGSEVGGSDRWQGKLRQVAIHNRALNLEQVEQNFAAGVGEKFYLLFGVSDWVDTPQSYLMFEVSQFDSYSYLFDKPTFISLDPTATPDGIDIQSMRIGINGRLAEVGQAYRFLDTQVTTAEYGANGQRLSPLGTIIALEKGPDGDEFFLSFDRLGNHEHVMTEAIPLAPPVPADGAAVADIGLRHFDEINATMAALTQVDRNQTAVRATFETIKQQLPTVESIEGFLSAQQMAIAQLSIECCNALVDDATLRSGLFPDFNFNQSHTVAFDSQLELDQVTLPLVDTLLGNTLLSQPDSATVVSELESLIDALDDSCSNDCGVERTHTVVKAACAATLGGATMLIQ
ncbi:ATPase [Solemya pervernicosa gill symbiont]|uniref:ATPase n=3 Tax=Gammaproteobacteria incertae sedis TaxID=118884 RepID=A0A1T2L387_9GAMM|nr:ATPase [Solemya pervernicosa gill symbiont]QKQ28242.1 LamG domain-containing protein [Candidatus Reidiella endopervernicosa]